MKVGIIGSGGREHAICQSLKNSNKTDNQLSNIYPVPIYSNPRVSEISSSLLFLRSYILE